MSIEEYIFLMNCQKLMKFPSKNVLLSIAENSLAFSRISVSFSKIRRDRISFSLKPLDLNDFS